jgi:spiro-SPASM protein
VKSFYEADIRADKIEQRIAEKPSLLRPMPTYLTVNLCEKNNQNPIYLPQSDGNSEFPDFSRFMQQTVLWMEKGYVEFSGTGEPLLHSDFKNILKTIASYPDFQFYLDTNGVYLDQYMDEIGAVPNLEVFININAPHRELYKAIHGSDDFEKAESNIEAFFARYPEKGYLQITRMMENEESLETFLERWRTLKDRIIIQKYNDFSGELEERKVVNLAPLTRFPCWKLQREMFIQADGSVSLCSQDYLKKNVLGNLEEASLQEIWENAQSIYASHWKENYPKICENCDQWYIFNF